MASIIRWNRDTASCRSNTRMAPNVHASNRWCVELLRFREALESVGVIIEFRSEPAGYRFLPSIVWNWMYNRMALHWRNISMDKYFYSYVYFIYDSYDCNSFCMAMEIRVQPFALSTLLLKLGEIQSPSHTSDGSFHMYIFRFVSLDTSTRCFDEIGDRKHESYAIKFDPVELFQRY